MRRNECLDLANFDLSTIASPEKGERLIRDTIRRNLALRLRDSGSRTWIIFATEAGKTTRRTLGDALAISVSSARAVAGAPGVAAPLSESATDTETAILPPNATLAEVLPRYLAFGAQSRWKASTGELMERVGRLYILPYLGAHVVRDIAPQEVAAWYGDMKLLGTSSRMSLSTLSGAMRFAEDHGLRKPGSNPCRRLRKKERSGRGRLLPETIVQRLWQALDQHEIEMLDACDAIRLLLLTGARKREILDLKWDQIAGCRAVLPDTKSGPRTVWLNSFARSILTKRQQVKTGEFVFPSKRQTGSISSIDRHWQILLADAAIPPMRLHDLRHHFAATGVSNSIDLKVVGQLLGHKEIDSTLGYAHLATSALVKSATRVSGLIDRSLGGAQPTVTPRRAPNKRIRKDAKRPSIGTAKGGRHA